MSAAFFILVALAIGIVLLVGELFLPTHGLLGVLGGAATVVSAVRALMLNQWLGVAEVLAIMIATPFAWVCSDSVVAPHADGAEDHAAAGGESAGATERTSRADRPGGQCIAPWWRGGFWWRDR